MKSLRLGLVLLLAGLGSFSAFASDDPILAKVNGKEIYLSDVNAFRAGLPHQVAGKVPPAVMLEQLVKNTVIVKQAKREDLDDNPAVKRSLADAELQILSKAWINKQIREGVTEEAMRQRYEQFKTKFEPKEEVRARHILVRTRKQALEIIEEIKNGGDFAKIANEKSIDPTARRNDGDLGYFGKEDMVPEFAEAAFAAKSGKLISTPIKTQFGWHVIKVEDKHISSLPTFEEMQNDLRQALASEVLEKSVKSLMDKADIEYFDANGNKVETPFGDKQNKN